MKIGLFGTYDKKYSRNSIIKKGLEDNDVEVIEIHSQIPISRLESPSDLGALPVLKRVFNNIKSAFCLIFQADKVGSCDLIIVLYPGHLILPVAKILCLILGKKLVFDSFMSLYESLIIDRNMDNKKSFKSLLIKYSEILLLKLPDLLMVDTDMMTDFLQKSLQVNRKKVLVVPLGANDDLYRPKVYKKNDAIKLVTFFGTYNPLQGAIYIVKAAKLLKRNKHIRFVMIGDGFLKKDIVDFAKTHDLTNIQFLSSVKESDLVTHINRSDIMLGIFAKTIYSQRVIPNKVFAALACRKPVITAKLKTLSKEFKDKKHLLFCRPQDAKDLAIKIESLVKNDRLARSLAEGGYEFYSNKFTPKIITEKMIQELWKYKHGTN